jgi:hypothetical protein
MSTYENDFINKIIATAVPGSKAAAEKWLPANYVPNIDPKYGQRIHVFFAFSGSDTVVEFTVNDADYRGIETAALVAGKAYHKVIPLRSGDSFNIRSVGGVTLDYCRVDLP